MHDEFTQNALSHGEEGQQWLDRIPSLITDYQKKWSLQVFPPFPLSYNYVAPAIRSDGSKAVLKIGFPKDKEFYTEIDALTLFHGEGVVRLLEVDRDNAVILIEQIIPGTPLSTLTDDDQATSILASVMKTLWKPVPQDHTFISIKEWMQAIPHYQNQWQGKNGPLPLSLVEKAAHLFNELIATSTTPVLTHGDLHHDNVLFSDRGGWLAIDPKGIAAEPAYETAAMIRNPYETVRLHKDIPRILTRRIHILSEELAIDPERIRQWGFAQTMLSAVWNIESAKGADHALAIAQVLDAIAF